MHTKIKTNTLPPQTMGVAYNNRTTATTEPTPKNGQQPNQPGAKMHLIGSKSVPYIYVVVKTQTLFKSHRGFLTNAMHHHREVI